MIYSVLLIKYVVERGGGFVEAVGTIEVYPITD
jgi:hypothetical protein